MGEKNGDPATEEWRKSVVRALKIWKRYVGGSNITLAQQLTDLGGLSINSATLGQNIRPGGRRPKEADKHLLAFAKLFAEKLSDSRRDLSKDQLRELFAAHLRTGATSPLENAPPRPPESKGAGLATALWSFDLWTPGQSADALISQFGAAMGNDGAQVVLAFSNDAIDAIARGDFNRQREIAESAIKLGKSVPETPLLGEGLYLKGEALRLLADFEPDRKEQRRLRLEAEQHYGQAEEQLRGDPRAIRGRARTIEVMGDLDASLVGFEKAQAAVEARITDQNEVDRLSLAHERIRTLRHKIACLAAMHEQAPLSTAVAQRRAHEIRRLIALSEPGHREALRLFQNEGDWWRIEWFMAQVLHAKSLSAIDENVAAAKRLEWSLKLRLELMPDEGPLSAVELGNLHWWSSIASNVRSTFEIEQQAALTVMLDAVKRGADRMTIRQMGTDFLRAGAAPWK